MEIKSVIVCLILVCCHINNHYYVVIPAKAGIQDFLCKQESKSLMVPCFRRDGVWIPVYTGMTKKTMNKAFRDSTQDYLLSKKYGIFYNSFLSCTHMILAV